VLPSCIPTLRKADPGPPLPDGADRFRRFTEEGAGIIDDPYSPGKFFTNPFGNYLGGINLAWQLDIYRELRNARDAAAQRYIAAIGRRNYFVTRLVADVAENYHGLMALAARLGNLDRIIELQERSLEIAQARKDATAAPTCLSSGSRPWFARTRAKS
jgi:outer membrane protein, multidrug efflux system